GRHTLPRAISSVPRRRAWLACRFRRSTCSCCTGQSADSAARHTRRALQGQARGACSPSNFTVALVQQAVRFTDEPLVCNQIEVHPFIDQSKVIAACRKYGMAIVAYSPIARGGVIGHKLLTRIGKTHGKAAAQVSLRFLVQQAIPVIPRTSRLERLAENFAIFDFALSEPEMAEIARLARRDGRIVDYAYSGSPHWD